MKVAVVTPYHTEPLDMLRRCHHSVAAQTYPCVHYIVADGHPQHEVDEWDAVHLVLPQSHGNNGNTPRARGTEQAIADGADAIAYLDADNWFEPGHICHLMQCHEKSHAPLVTSGRRIRGIDGTVLLPDGQTSDGIEIADTSTMLFTRAAFPALRLWGTMPDELSANCDTFVFKGTQALGFAHHHNGEPTVNFTSRYALHYRAAGAAVPADATAMQAKKKSDDMLRRLGPRGLSHVLAGGSLEDWFAAGLSAPIALIVLAEPSELSEDQIAFAKTVKSCLELETGSEVLMHYNAPDSLNVALAPFIRLTNIFALTFAISQDERTAAGRFAEKNGRVGVIYVRRTNTATPQDFDSPLDRRAWLVLTDNMDTKSRYLATCRYGDTHVGVCKDTDLAQRIAAFITTTVR